MKLFFALFSVVFSLIVFAADIESTTPTDTKALTVEQIKGLIAKHINLYKALIDLRFEGCGGTKRDEELCLEQNKIKKTLKLQRENKAIEELSIQEQIEFFTLVSN
ncbi:MAG: hypothetical protein KC505_03425 [Myxococcales bacterium]|nr:hypothetical protein [Myxococcales bacterium]USN50714.1 MAG: hypothetical protein H6731_10730 [Myxococcales bacterium]